MTREKKLFKVLVATDGSPAAQAALQTALRFPWPEPSGARVVVAARHSEAAAGLDLFEETWRQAAHQEVESARLALASRWPAAETATPEQLPAEAVLTEARRRRANAIVLGWRGHGRFKRLLMGSVSRAIVERAPCPVLVVSQAPRSVKRFVLGYDDSPQARRAVQMFARMPAPAGGRVSLVAVVEFLRPMSNSWLPASVRADLKAEAARMNAEALERARQGLESAARRITAAGWHVKTVAIDGAPLAMLLSACKELHADVLVVGARAKRGVERALLGSVANGALDRSGRPVLVVP